MSYKRLRENVQKYPKAQPAVLPWKPVIITDSKGKYLRQVSVADKTESKILWYGRGGFNSNDVVKFLSVKKINSLLKLHGRISLYLWVGTCDFTRKGKRHVYLRKPLQKTFDQFRTNLETIKRRCSSSRIKLTFVHVPFYSIEIWNKNKGHPNVEIFKKDDKELTELIRKVNCYIDNANNDINSYSPRLNADIERSRKRKNGKQRYSLRFSLFIDGIHPDKKLARSWLTSIKRRINIDCQ